MLFGLIAGFASAPAPARAESQHMKVAVTVDDLPANGDLLPGITRMQITEGVLHALKANGITEAYGFANGTDIAKEPELLEVLKAWLRAGYPIGNHTFTHADLDQVGIASYLSDIEQMQKLLDTLAPMSAIKDGRCFRYPYMREGISLEQRDAVRNFLSANGYKVAQVTINWEDWAWNEAYTRCVRNHDDKSAKWLERQVVAVAEQQLRNSKDMAEKLFKRDIAHILLIHDNMFNAAVLDSILQEFRRQGVQMITLNDALADPVYQLNPGVTARDGIPFLERIAASRNIKIDSAQATIYMRDALRNVCKQ